MIRVGLLEDVSNMDYPTPIVSAEWLHAHLNEASVQVIDCRFALMDPALGVRQYQSGHIPGAAHLDLNRHLSNTVQRHGGRHPLPDVDALAKTIGQAGIQSKTSAPDSSEGHRQPTFAVVYDDSRFAFASRLWWLLRYLGHPHVAVLDGGFQGWQSAGYPVSQDGFVAQASEFIPEVQTDWVVDIQQVKHLKDLASTVLVDSRQGDRYRGEREPIDPIAGHIPGAVNLFWQDVTTEESYAHSAERQRQRWQSVLHTAHPDGTGTPTTTVKDIIVYCGSGVTACVNLLSLELAQQPPGKLYAGSWSDWCSYL